MQLPYEIVSALSATVSIEQRGASDISWLESMKEEPTTCNDDKFLHRATLAVLKTPVQ